MARITIEDCLTKVPNKYVLVRMAAERAWLLMTGTIPLVENKENNREIVLALREIAAGKVKYKKLTEEEYLEKLKQQERLF